MKLTVRGYFTHLPITQTNGRLVDALQLQLRRQSYRQLYRQLCERLDDQFSDQLEDPLVDQLRELPGRWASSDS